MTRVVKHFSMEAQCHDKFERPLTKTKKTRGNMYQMRVNVREKCNFIKEESKEGWLWHNWLCH